MLLLSNDKSDIVGTGVAIPTRQFCPGRVLEHATACPICREVAGTVGWSTLARILSGPNMNLVMTG